jgi:hypothetical protein
MDYKIDKPHRQFKDQLGDHLYEEFTGDLEYNYFNSDAVDHIYEELQDKLIDQLCFDFSDKLRDDLHNK